MKLPSSKEISFLRRRQFHFSSFHQRATVVTNGGLIRTRASIICYSFSPNLSEAGSVELFVGAAVGDHVDALLHFEPGRLQFIQQRRSLERVDELLGLLGQVVLRVAFEGEQGRLDDVSVLDDLFQHQTVAVLFQRSVGEVHRPELGGYHGNHVQEEDVGGVLAVGGPQHWKQSGEQLLVVGPHLAKVVAGKSIRMPTLFHGSFP